MLAKYLDRLAGYLNTRGSFVPVFRPIVNSSKPIFVERDGVKWLGSGANYRDHGAGRWAVACESTSDYAVAKSIESFAESFGRLADQTTLSQPELYVSLGPGNGAKDATVLQHFQGTEYISVDGHWAMAVTAARRTKAVTTSPSPAFELDFSDRYQMGEFASLLHRAVPGGRKLYGFLGNTVSNDHDDAGFLGAVTHALFPGDQLMLEVARTATADQGAARAAAAEYRDSADFRAFATSGLRDFTNLRIDPDRDLEIVGSVEPGAVKVSTYYVNRSGDAQRVVLPAPHPAFLLEPGGAIGVMVTRKYTASGVDDRLLAPNGLRRVADSVVHPNPVAFPHRGAQFGTELMVLAPGIG